MVSCVLSSASAAAWALSSWPEVSSLVLAGRNSWKVSYSIYDMTVELTIEKLTFELDF